MIMNQKGVNQFKKKKKITKFPLSVVPPDGLFSDKTSAVLSVWNWWSPSYPCRPKIELDQLNLTMDKQKS